MGDNIFTKNIAVIVNPVAGTRSKKRVLKQIGELRKENPNIRILFTGYPQHARILAEQEVEAGTECVFAVGGDGTVNEVASGLVGSRTALGIIPHGSGNGLARHLHIPMGVKRAIKALTTSTIERMDYGVANDHMFFCTCGVGYDAKVSEKVLYSKRRGLLMYGKNMVDVFAHFDPESYHITSEGGTFSGRAFTVICANASQYGNNAYIAPHASIQDGRMNLAIIEPLSVPNVPKMAIQLFTKRINNNAKMSEALTSSVVIEREKGGVMHLDGDALYAGPRIEISMVSGGLNVLVPSNRKFTL